MDSGKTNGIYKTMTLCLITALLSMVGSYFTLARTMVTKEELPALIQQNNPYTQDAKNIETQLADLKERIILLDAYQKQIGQDVSNIAAKAGVTAHPITDSESHRR